MAEFLQKEVDERRIRRLEQINNLTERIRTLPIWSSASHLDSQSNIYSRRHCFHRAVDLSPSEIEGLKKICKEMLDMISNEHDSVVLIRILEQVANLAAIYYPVRQVFNNLGAATVLRSAAQGSNDNKIDVLIENTRFTLEKNDVYAFCETFYQGLSGILEVDAVEIKIGLEPYLKHLQLSDIAQKHYDFLALEGSASRFMYFAMASMMPECVDLRPMPKDPNTKSRVLAILLHYATGPYSTEKRLEALKNIVQMIFRCKYARALLTEMNIIPALLQAAENETSLQNSQPSSSQLYMKLAKRAELCLQDCYIFPKSENYFSELNETLLDLIIEYMRAPDLLFIAANALSYIWINVLPKASKGLFIRLLSFLVESYSEIKEYKDRSGAELLYTTVLEKLEQLSDNITKDYVEICHSQVVDQLLRLFSTEEAKRLYPSARVVARRLLFPGIDMD